MKDGDSAKLKGLFVSKLAGGGRVLCGRVNAKNSFGAYTGFSRFIAGAADDAPVLIEGQEIGLGEHTDAYVFLAAYQQFCSNPEQYF